MTVTLTVGVACFSTFGGSGVVASEIAMALARRGHRVHVFSDDVPGRLDQREPNLVFHAVEVRAYPQLKHPPYTLALTSKLVEVARRERLDVIHAHYAIPHSASAYLARQILAADSPGAAPKIVTTLHGTDITLVGADDTFLPLTQFTIGASDAVTTPSAWLREATYASLGVSRTVAIDVIPNFVDTARFAPSPTSRSARSARSRTPPMAGPVHSQPQVIVHVSNFRPVKRVDDVVRVFARVRAALPGRPLVLHLVGDGPERPQVTALAHSLGLDADVHCLGERVDLPDVLRSAALFLLPSETESFGLAALEAMACGVPVIASAVGGLPEVVGDGETGLLLPVGDVDAMAHAVVALLTDHARLRRMSLAARHRAETYFRPSPAVDRYLEVYERTLGAQESKSGAASSRSP